MRKIQETSAGPENNFTFQLEDEIIEYPNDFSYPRLPFWQKLLIYIAVWAVLIAAACGVMWNIMQQYEISQPWYAVENYITSSGQSAFYSALLKAYPETENTYESIYEVAGKLSAEYTGRVSYKKLIREYTYENPVYLLHSEDTNLLKITLEQGEKTGFLGLRGYRICETELVASDLLSLKNYGLVFPTGAQVFVNGKHLSEEDLTENAVFPLFGDGAFTACLLENFFERPTINVLLDGKDIPAKEGDHFIFDPENALRTLHITAPEGAVVRIDSERVSDFFITGETNSEPDHFGNTVPMVEYTVPTVIGKGVVTMAQDGKALQTVTANETATAKPLTYGVTLRIPPTAVLYANGNAVKTVFVTDMHSPLLSDFEGVNGYPESHTYVIDGLYTLPEFTAADGGIALATTEDNGVTVFIPEASEALKAAYTEQAIDYMNAYLYYTTQGYANTRQNLNAVKAHVAYPSPLYTNLERSYIGYYYIAPQQMTVESMTVDHFIPFGTDMFTCELSYKIALSNWVGATTDANTMRITFAKQANGEYMPVNMVLLNK